MPYTYQLIKKSSHKTAQWAGGTTTELAIYPPHSSYEARNFRWRLSTAKVLQRETVFTSLPGYRRILMVLEGAMVLAHEREHIANLASYGKDKFDGSWTTHCIGTGRDFNIMLGEGCEGNLDMIDDNESHAIKAVFDKLHTVGFFCADSMSPVKSVLTLGEKEFFLTLSPGDLLLISNDTPGQETETDFKIRFITPQIKAQFHMIHFEITCTG